jgi:hypothetical protein
MKYLYDKYAESFSGIRTNTKSRKWIEFCKQHSIKDTSREMAWRLRNRKIGVEYNCKKCDGPLPFKGNKEGFITDYCSVSCAQTDRTEFGGFATAEGYQKSRNTIKKKYGVSHQAHIPEVHEQSQAKRYKNYLIESPSKKQYSVQGFERYAIPDLWKEVEEEDLIVRKADIPTIYYEDEEGKRRRYYPDAMIVSTNTMIEIKSEYTLKDPLLPSKIVGTTESGYNMEVIIYGTDGMEIRRKRFCGE